MPLLLSAPNGKKENFLLFCLQFLDTSEFLLFFYFFFFFFGLLVGDSYTLAHAKKHCSIQMLLHINISFIHSMQKGEKRTEKGKQQISETRFIYFV